MAIQSLKSDKTSRRSFSHLQAWFMANGFFWMWQSMVPFLAGTHVSKIMVNFFASLIYSFTMGL